MLRYRLRTLLQFRLATLLLAVTVFGVWLGIQVNRAHRQKRAIAAIESVRGIIHFDYQRDAKGQRIPDAEPSGPKWLRKLIGDDYFRKVVTVDFATEFYGRRKELGLSKVDDAGLRCLESLPDIERLELGHNRAVTDAGLVHLQNLKELQILWLYDCGVTGTGLRHIAGLPNLTILDLRWCPVTHEGLIELRRLRRLEFLSLGNTSITNDNLTALRPLFGLKKLRIDNTNVTDDGLVHLESLVGLEELLLPASISDDALSKLQKRLPNCRITRVKERR